MYNQNKVNSYPNILSCIPFNNRLDVIGLSEMFDSILDMSLTVEGGSESKRLPVSISTDSMLEQTTWTFEELVIGDVCQYPRYESL